MSVDVGSAIGYLDLDTTKFNKGFKSAISDLKIFNSKTATTSQKLSTLSGSMSKMGSSLTTGVTLPIVGLGAATVKTAATFEKGMSQVKAISRASGKEMESLKAKAIEMGAKTKFSASESADAFKFMAQAGWTTSEMIDGIGGVMNLAAASGEDLASSSSIVTDALTAFGLKAADATKFADVLAMTANATNVDVAQMGESFKYVAPVAGALGYKLEDVSVALGVMANNGIKGSQAGTALRTLMTNLAKPTDNMAVAMKKYNISMTDSHGKMLPLNELLANLRDRFDGLSKKQKASLAATLAGKEGMSGLLSIVTASDSSWESLTKNINNAGGSAKEAADIMQDNLSGSLEQLGGGIESLAISFGDILSPAIRKMADMISGYVDKLNSMSKSQRETIVMIAAIAAAAGPVLLIGGKIVGVISTIVSVISTVGGAISGAVGAISTAVTAAGSLGGAFAALGATISGFVSTAVAAITPFIVPILAVVAAVAALKLAWDSNFNGIQEKTAQIFDSISSIISSVMETINAVITVTTETLKSAWEDNFLGIQYIVEGVFNNIKITFATALDVIVEVFALFADLFNGNWSGVWEHVKEIFSILWDGIIALYRNILNTIVSVMKEILPAIVEWFKNLWGNVKTAFSTAWDSIYNATTKTVSNLVSSIVKFFSSLPGKIGDFVSQIPTKMAYFLGLAVGTVVKFGADAIKTVSTEVPKLISKIVGFFTQLPGKIWDAFLLVIGKTSTWINNMVESAGEGLVKFIKSVVKFFSDLPKKIADELANVTKKVLDWCKDLIVTGAVAVNNAVESIFSFFGELPKKMLDIGVNVVKGIWDGIKNTGGWIKDKVTGWCGSFVDGFKDALGIHSPSVVFMVLGEYLNQGLAKGILKSKNMSVKALEEVGNLLKNTGNAISTGLITIDEATNSVSYSSTYTTVMKKIDLYYKDRDKRISSMKKGTEKNIASLNDEISATRTATDLKIQLYQQELTAKQALVDSASNSAIAAVQAEIDAIDKAKETESREESTNEFNKELADKNAELEVASEEDKTKILQEIQELKLKRNKELQDIEREDKKEALRQQIEDIRAGAEEEKATLQEGYDAKVYSLEQEYNAEVAHMGALLAVLEKDYTKRQELAEVDKAIKKAEKDLESGDLSKEEEKRTAKELVELKARRKNLKDTIAKNKKTIKNFTKDTEESYKNSGKSLEKGIKSTEKEIKAYFDSLKVYASKVFNGLSASVSVTTAVKSSAESSKVPVDGSHADGLGYVPKNGYIAELHEGEAVLTKKQNEERANSGGDVFNFYSPKALTPSESARQMKKAKQEMALGFL